LKIGFLFPDKGFVNVDLSNPRNGNNGVGGTQYSFVYLGFQLAKNKNYELYFYHFNNNLLPFGINSVICPNVESIFEKAKNDCVDILIFWTDYDVSLINLLSKYELNGILWAHNNLTYSLVKACEKSHFLKRVIFVGKQEYDRYIDCDIIYKSDFIYNMFDGNFFEKRELPSDNNVAYVGSLVYDKGFHVLASIWKKILKKVPTAKLFVIGNGKLYDRNSKLGKFGLTNEKYENKFIPYIIDNDKIIDSVIFLGSLGIEKNEYFKKIKVGVVNPTAKSETFGLSAIEMEAFGIPVVSKAKNGMYETVLNRKTGVLVHNKRQLKKAIITLLKNNKMNNLLSKQAKEFSNSAFLPNDICDKWCITFDEIQNNKLPRYVKPKNHFFNNGKFFRIINRYIRKIFRFLPSFLQLEYFCRKIIKK